MNERKKLLRRIQTADFVLLETGLYLDTHPNDQEALNYYKKYVDLKRDATREYVSKFGPIRADDFTDSPHWNWVDNPWPWELEV